MDDAPHAQSTTDIPAPLKSATVYYFGSLQKATTAATKDRLCHLRVGLQQRFLGCTGKQILAYTKVRRDNLPLVRAAEKQFGSWGKALYAAGIDPNLYCVERRLREPKMTLKRSFGLWQPT